MTTKSRFVLHSHQAIRRGEHLDLRFKMPNSNNWASFAINKKEIPTKEGERIYIVRTNMHSEKEALFTGKIPEGQYGAGIIKEIDKGDCEIEKYTNAKIVITFNGKKLKGKYYIINTGLYGKRHDYSNKTYAFFKAKEKLYEQYLNQINQE